MKSGKGTASKDNIPAPNSPHFSDPHSVNSSGRYTPTSRRFISSQTRNNKFFTQNHSGNQPSNLGSPQRLNMVLEESFTASDRQQVIMWGTNINIEDIERKFEEFLSTFRFNREKESMQIEEDSSDLPSMNLNQTTYLDKLNQCLESDNISLLIDGEHIFQYDKFLYYQLINFPGEIIPLFDKVTNQVADDKFNRPIPNMIQVGIVNLKTTHRMRELNPKDVNHLVQIKGIVIRCSDVYPEMKDGVFVCSNCGKQERVAVERGRINEPRDCQSCKVKESFELVHNLCLFSDKQYIRLQETPETVPDGETPQTLMLIAYDDNVDAVKPGDKLECIGIYRAQGMRMFARKKIIKSVFRTYMDVISFDKSSKDYQVSLEKNPEEDFNQETKAKLMNLANDPQIYEKLVKAFAPSIWENDDVKKGILCQLFGGTQKDFSEAGKGRFRADINCLLVGDPSTAKSQLLQYVHKIAPRGIYTSGKGSSAVGLTAYISKDPETKELILESGAIVLSDKGICCIDEFDKMDENTRTILHEAMEQQTISIAKTGIVCQLNARTAILASANPVDSRYNPRKSVIDNIKLPPSLLSRFDLIYLMLDKNNEAHDRKLASHILSLYSLDYQMNGLNIEVEIDKKLLSKYISFARQNINPEISEDVVDDLIDGYCEMRKIGTGRNVITATPRQLESLIRISEALAKMRYSSIVEKKDVQEAMRLIRVATQQAATDPTTGLIDMDMISTGITTISRSKIHQICQYIKELIKGNEEAAKQSGFTFVQMLEECRKHINTKDEQDVVNEKELLEALRLLEEEDYVVLNGNKKKPIVKLGGGPAHK